MKVQKTTTVTRIATPRVESLRLLPNLASHTCSRKERAEPHLRHQMAEPHLGPKKQSAGLALQQRVCSRGRFSSLECSRHPAAAPAHGQRRREGQAPGPLHCLISTHLQYHLLVYYIIPYCIIVSCYTLLNCQSGPVCDGFGMGCGSCMELLFLLSFDTCDFCPAVVFDELAGRLARWSGNTGRVDLKLKGNASSRP